MACFIAPAAAAIVATSMKKKVPAKYHVEWLLTMLWGGVVMLIVDHVASGEVTVYPPFITAMKSPEDTLVMLKEIATIGVAMTIAVFIFWISLVFMANYITKLREKKIKIINS
ncbi:MAG: hypothetical protein WC752_03015 [Patescibacteria group bacterium]|jgi:hypothetical protein